MKRIGICLVAFVFVSACNARKGGGKQATGSAVPQDTLAAEAREVKRRYDIATLKNDGKWFQETLADDYVWYGPRGEVVSKAQYVEDLVSRNLVWESVEAKDMAIRVYGNTAIATGRFFGKAKFKGAPLEERQRFTSVLVKTDGRWKIVAEHCSTLAAADQEH